jgi:hypothetical protein
MRFCSPFLLALALLIFWNLPVSSAEKNDTVIEAITFQSVSERGENIRFKLNGEHIPKIFFIQDVNPRLVLDFLDARCANSVNRAIDAKGKLVKKIRVGIHSDQAPKVRVVVDLAPNEKYQHKQHFDGQDKTLVVNVFSTSEGTSHKEKGKKEVTADAAKGPDTQKPVPTVSKEPEQPSAATESKGVGKASEKTASSTMEPENTTVTSLPPEISIAGKETEKSIPEVMGAKPAVGKEEKAAPKEETQKVGKDEKVAARVETPAVGKEEKAASTVEIPEKKSVGKKTEPSLSNVTFENTSTKGEMVLFKLNGFHPPTVFGIEKGDPKVVCDFPNARLEENVREVIRCDGKFVESIRVTKQTKPNKIRAVLNLVPNKNYDLQQVFFKEDNLFVIIVNAQDGLPAGKTGNH